MIRIFIAILTGIIIASCGDTAQGPGEKAGEEHNRRTSAGTGEIHNDLESDTSKSDGNFIQNKKEVQHQQMAKEIGGEKTTMENSFSLNTKKERPSIRGVLI